MYETLTRFITDFSNTYRFIESIDAFVKENPEFDLTNYSRILEEHHIPMNLEVMKTLDISPLSNQVLLAITVSIWRGDRFCEGLLDEAIATGVLQKYLEELDARDRKSIKESL